MNEARSPREERAADIGARSLYYDRNGNPISLEGWAFLFEKDDRQIRHDVIGDVTISTVWLGINHAVFPIDGRILIFETMIFGGDHEQDIWRYATEDEAVAGHERITREIKAGLTPGA
jgi:hypothetical protein